MTLDEAIRHAEEVADTCEYDASKWDMTDAYEQSVACGLGKCAEEHRQLAEWLQDYKRLLEYDDALYHEEHGEVIVDKDVWEDAKKALEVGNHTDVTDTNVGKMDGDCISRQAVMERIENEYRQWGEEYDVQQVLGDIEDLPSVTPKTQWIPVSEQLPITTSPKDYWVCTDKGYCCKAEWLVWHWNYHNIPTGERIIAWQELPEPYRKDGDTDVMQRL